MRVFTHLSMLLIGVACAEQVELFNGKDLSNWTYFLAESDAAMEDTWKVEDGVIKCTGEPAGYIRTKEPCADYTLTVEWRWPGDGGNNGVLVHVQPPDKVWPKSIEAQMESGHAGDIWVIDGADFKEHHGVAGRRVAKQEASSEKPLGEWNTYTIVAKGDTLRLYVNGVLQNVATECTLKEGFIALQSEGRPIEYRRITLQKHAETALETP
jgi:hypothetical protein